jgi:hypothetical protein
MFGLWISATEKALLFVPEEIPIAVQKKEPIPTDSLFVGLLALFERTHSELIEADLIPDWDTVLFYRDGPLQGDGDAWNELDALTRLYEELRKRSWVNAESVWTVVEILKNAENWRVLRRSSTSEATNALVGQCVFPFEDSSAAIVCTTGSPYLTQGTSLPLLVRITDISGRAQREKVMRDFIWQGDLCFTKPDMGMRLPWVLHVADTGALQSSRSYKISGITA